MGRGKTKKENSRFGHTAAALLSDCSDVTDRWRGGKARRMAISPRTRSPGMTTRGRRSGSCFAVGKKMGKELGKRKKERMRGKEGRE